MGGVFSMKIIRHFFLDISGCSSKQFEGYGNFFFVIQKHIYAPPFLNIILLLLF